MSGLRVLVADDEPLARAMIVRLLREDGDIGMIEECGDAETLMQLVEGSSVDIAFLDVEMPSTNGLAIASDWPPDTPVVVYVTAHAMYAKKAMEAGAADYVLKPFTDQRFRDAVRRAKQRAANRVVRDAATGVSPVSRARRESS